MISRLGNSFLVYIVSLGPFLLFFVFNFCIGLFTCVGSGHVGVRELEGWDPGRPWCCHVAGKVGTVLTGLRWAWICGGGSCNGLCLETCANAACDIDRPTECGLAWNTSNWLSVAWVGMWDSR